MSLTFALRDDDTCYFTDPQRLEAVYRDVWGKCPVSLAVVPFQACTRSGAVPREFWSGDRVFPLGDNTELVRFLRERIAQRELHVMLHGFSHRDEPDGFEFEAGAELAEKLRRGRRYLEDLLDIRVTAFVPPHNALSPEGYRAVVASGLLLSGRTDPRIQRGPAFDLLRFSWIRAGERIARRKHPRVIRYRRHREVGFHALTPRASLPALLRAIDDCHRRDGVFVLATHYWEFDARMETDPSMTQADALRSVWTRVSSLPGVGFAAVGDLT